nr:ATP synthase F0 subunit 8 [Peloridora minuta]
MPQMFPSPLMVIFFYFTTIMLMMMTNIYFSKSPEPKMNNMKLYKKTLTW